MHLEFGVKTSTWKTEKKMGITLKFVLRRSVVMLKMDGIGSLSCPVTGEFWCYRC
jgi:hypothetical protein